MAADRLAALKKKRREREGGDSEDVRLSIRDEKDEEADAEMQKMMKPFNDIKHGIESIERHNNKIDSLRMEASQNSNPQEQKQYMDQLNMILTAGKKDIMAVKKLISTQRESNKEFDAVKANKGSATSQWRNNLLNTYTRQLQDVVIDYQQKSTHFRKMLRGKIKRLLSAVDPDADHSDEKVEEMLKTENPMQFLQEAMQIPAELLDKVAEIEERHEGMLRIERSVKEIQEMFQEVAILVEMQGERLDNIEGNVATTRDFVKKAEGDLVKAEKAGRKARKLMCCTLIVFLVVLVVVLSTVLSGAFNSA